MSTHKHIDAICIVIVLCTLIVAILFMNGETLGISVVSNEENSSEFFTENDLNSSWDTADATQISLSDDGKSTVKGNGAYINDGDVYIVYGGKYRISGKLSDGQILIEANGNDKIWLMLDGVSVNCSDDAAVRIEQAGKVFFTLADGTENALSSGASYNDNAVSENVDGAIYSRDDVTINGSGKLSVKTEYRHGIVCNDDLVIIGGSISVTAVQDGVHTNDSVRIKNADITVSAGNDGITVSNDDETAYMYIESGNISIPSCYEGLEAVRIDIAGGNINIKPTDDGINANGYGENSVINISGGEITVTNENGRDSDGLDSNKDIYISGGKIFISVGDDGGNNAIDFASENGGICKIDGGTVIACGSGGMAEGFDSSSSQGFLIYGTSASAGTEVSVKDSDGKVLLSEVVPYSFSSVIVSTPEMKVGDTCTLTVGETETEMTIDNSSNSTGLGGNRMRGGKGRMGMFGNEDSRVNVSGGEQLSVTTVAEMSDNTEENSRFADRPTLPNGQDGNMIQENSDGGVQPPEMPDGAVEGDIPSDNFRGKRDFGELPDGEKNMLNRGEDSRTAETDTTISAENIILLGISFIVLIIGCLIGFFFKRRC